MRRSKANARRAFARRSKALAAAAILCSCAPVHAPPSLMPPESVRIIESDAPTLDSLINDSPTTSVVDELVMSYLLRADARGRAIPDLAVRVPTLADGGISRDGRTIVYRLRHGVRWQDGKPFSARDVAFSFGLAIDPRTNVPDRSEYANVVSVRAPDPYTVIVKLRDPSASAVGTFFALTANDPYPILPAHGAGLAHDPNRAPFNSAAVGTGPYTFVEWRRGDRVILRANPSYYAGKPAIERIDVETMPDGPSAAVAIRSGDFDVAYGEATLGARAVDFARFITRSAPVESSDYLLFNSSQGVMRDERLRAALVRAVDVHRLASQFLPAGAARFAATDRLPGTPGYDPTLEHAVYDPTTAARMLDAAGYRLRGGARVQRDGTPLAPEIVCVASATEIRLATLVQANLRALGIAATIHTYPYQIFYDSYAGGGVLEHGRFDIASTGWSYGGVADHTYLYACASRPPNGENYAGICDPVIERAHALVNRSADPEAQARAFAAISRELVARSYIDMLWFNSYRFVVRRGLIGPEPSLLIQPIANAASWHYSKSASPGTTSSQ